MAFWNKERQPTRLIFVRHLHTATLGVREEFKSDSNHKDLVARLAHPNLSVADIAQIHADGKAIIAKFPYSSLHLKDNAPLLPGQEEVGMQIGGALVEKYNNLGEWEYSPLLRTAGTSELLREGIHRRFPSMILPSPTPNVEIEEKRFGLASTSPSAKIFLATHREELLKYIKDRRHYRFGNGESRVDFWKRQKRQMRREQRARKYEGKDNVFVTHSMVIETRLQNYVNPDMTNENISPGSITVFEAGPKKFLCPRKFRLVSEVGIQLVPPVAMPA